MRTRTLTAYGYAFILSGLLFLLDSTALLDPIKLPVQSLFLPIQQIVADVSARYTRVVGNIWQMWYAQKQYEALQVQYNQLLAKEAKMELVAHENRMLAMQLASTLGKQKKLMHARIIARYPDIVVDRGSVDHVAEDMIVVVGDILVGKIVRAGPKTSRVQLPSDSSSKIMVSVHKSNQKGVLLGTFGAAMHLEKILQTTPLSEGQLVVTSGEDGIFPVGLSVGKVTRIQKRPSDLFQEADVAPLLDINQTDIVFIIVD